MTDVAVRPAEQIPEPVDQVGRAPDRAGQIFAIVVGVLLAASVIVRFSANQALWLDEAQSVAIARLPLHGAGFTMWDGLLQDGSPPLYYVLLHLWIDVFGAGNIGVRSLSAVINIGAAWPLFVLSRRVVGERAAKVTVVLYLTSPFALYFGTETRMYSLIVLLTALGGLALERVLRAPSATSVIGLALSSGGLALTHYWCLYLLLTVGVWLIVLVLVRPRLVARRAARAAATPDPAGGSADAAGNQAALGRPPAGAAVQGNGTPGPASSDPMSVFGGGAGRPALGADGIYRPDRHAASGPAGAPGGYGSATGQYGPGTFASYDGFGASGVTSAGVTSAGVTSAGVTSAGVTSAGVTSAGVTSAGVAGGPAVANGRAAGAPGPARSHRTQPRYLTSRQRGPVLGLVGIVGGGIVFAPWLPNFFDQLAHTGTPWGEPASYAAISHAYGQWAGGPTTLGRLLLFLITGLAAAGIAGRSAGRRFVLIDLRGLEPGRTLFFIATGTLVVAVTAGKVVGNAWADRYTATAFVPFLLVIGLGATIIADQRLFRGIVVVAALVGLLAGTSDVRRERTQAGEAAQVLERLARPGDVMLVCPDQLGPGLARTVPSWMKVYVVPTYAPPDRVDWVDYEKRNETANGVAIAQRALNEAGPDHTVFLAGSGAYRTYEELCTVVRTTLQDARPVADEVMKQGSPPQVYENYALLRFRAS